MADDRTRFPGDQGDPRDPERTAAHRLGPPMRPMRPGAPAEFSGADTGFVDRVTDDGAPVDVAAVRRDDDLIEALAAGGAVSTADGTEFALASLLADWRDEIVTTPVPSGPSLDEIAAALSDGSRGRGPRMMRFARPVPPVPVPVVAESSGEPAVGEPVTDISAAPSRRNRRFGLVAGAAAAALAILGGGTVLVNSAGPDDGPLWSVKEVVFAEAASQTLATSQANAQIATADQEIDASNPAAAREALVSARKQAAKVKNDRDRAALEDKIREAEVRAGLPVGSTDLPTSVPSTTPSTVPPVSTTVPPVTTTVPVPPPPVTAPTYPTYPTYPTTTVPRPTYPTTTTPPIETTEPTTAAPSPTDATSATEHPTTAPSNTVPSDTPATTTTAVRPVWTTTAPAAPPQQGPGLFPR